jgi:hypothetical protein
LKSISIVLGIAGLALLSVSVMAETSFIIETGLTQKVQSIRLKELEGQKAPKDQEEVADNEFTALRLGIGGLYENFYSIFHYDVPLSTRQDYLGAFEQAQRQDYDLTLGYNIWNGLSVFGGYKVGETIIDRSTGAPNNSRDRFREQGPFIGASYGYEFKGIGSLGISLAYANMLGVTRFKVRGGTPDTTENYESDIKGLSYGLKWIGNLDKAWSYNIDIRRNDYEMDSKLDKAVNVTPFSDFKHSETYTIYTIGMMKVF